MKSYAQVAASVAKKKAEHPERFCSHPKCLWRLTDIHGQPNPCRNHPHLNKEK